MDLLHEPGSNYRLSLAVLIPAWQPDARLPELARHLLRAGFPVILVIDDGSGQPYDPIFDQLQSLPEVRLLRHAVNLGKGRALKTGIDYFLANCPSLSGLVTADADGQHTVADIVHVAEALSSSSGRVVLGSRDFNRNVPPRSRLGNTLTRHIFAVVIGARLTDTQTGLRAFPRAALPALMTLAGDRYEYEMSVLAHLCRAGKTPVEVPIQTIYIQDNRSSHFDPLSDSMRIYFVLARFASSSLLAATIDFVGFFAVFAFTGNLLLSVCIGRLSSLVNYALNRRYVFHSRHSVAGTLWRYYLLVLLIACLSYAMIASMTGRLHWNILVAKVAADVVLSLVSFSVQRTFVFRRTQPSFAPSSDRQP